MGFHRLGFVPIGAYVQSELRDYIDELTIERGFLTRSDAIREIIREHQSFFSDKIGRNVALTPEETEVNDRHQGFLKKGNINEIRGEK